MIVLCIKLIQWYKLTAPVPRPPQPTTAIFNRFAWCASGAAPNIEGVNKSPPVNNDDPFTKLRRDKLFFFCSMVKVLIN